MMLTLSPNRPDLDRYDTIWKEVFGAFERAGCSLTETNPAGQILLHMATGRDSARAWPWFNFLQAKGLEPMAKDKNVMTTLDIREGKRQSGMEAVPAVKLVLLQPRVN